jgi:hypothetical protein
LGVSLPKTRLFLQSRFKIHLLVCWAQHSFTIAQLTIIWELNESPLQKKFQRAVMACTDFGLNVNLNKCVDMKISQKTGGMEKTKCNNHEIKYV